MEIAFILAFVVCISSAIAAYVAYTMNRPITIPKHVDETMDRLDKTVRGKTPGEAVRSIRSFLPGWKIKEFDIDDPNFMKKYDQWDLRNSKPDTVVILASKGVVTNLGMGPTGGKGILTESRAGPA